MVEILETYGQHLALLGLATIGLLLGAVLIFAVIGVRCACCHPRKLARLKLYEPESQGASRAAAGPGPAQAGPVSSAPVGAPRPAVLNAGGLSASEEAFLKQPLRNRK